MSDAARAIRKIGPGQKDPRMNSRVDNLGRDTRDGYFNFALGDPPLPLSFSCLSLPFTIPPFLESRRRARARARVRTGNVVFRLPLRRGRARFPARFTTSDQSLKGNGDK